MKRNVQMWIALDKNGNDVFIEDAIPGQDYYCPKCDGIVHSRAKDSNKITEHFYHLDNENCDGGESALHKYWKYHLVAIGDEIELPYIGKIQCQNRWIEYSTNDGKYRPDLIIKSNHPKYKFIVFEILNTNKKSIEEYRYIWKKYNYPVYEVDVKRLKNDKDNFCSCVKILYSQEKLRFEMKSKRVIRTLYNILEKDGRKLDFDQYENLSSSLRKVYKIFKKGLDKPNKTNLNIIERDLTYTFVDKNIYFNFSLPLKRIVSELRFYI